MPLCSVITCKWSQEGHDGEAEGLSFHLFPANAEIRAKWVDMTGRDGWVPTSKDFICSRHFRDNDYFIKRSGKRYLKTSAIPCEYVVYRDLYFDEDVDVKFEVNEAEASVAVEDHAEEPVILIPDEEAEDNFEVAERSDASRTFPLFNLPLPANQEPDSTIGTFYDMNENGTGDWERFRNERFFGQRLPVSIFEDNSQEVGSSGIDERYRRDVGSSVNPYPLDLRPLLDLRPHSRLPPPGTPELVTQSIQQEHIPDVEEDIPEPATSPVVESQGGRKKLENIKRIMTRRKSSKKAIEATLAEVREAQKVKTLLQSGQMTEYDKAAAIITIQNRQIVKLNIKHRRLKKTLKRISAVLRGVSSSSD